MDDWDILNPSLARIPRASIYLDQYFKGAENHVLLHDLRFVVDGDVAQIDHLIINRGFGMYLVETKNYAGSLAISPAC